MDADEIKKLEEKNRSKYNYATARKTGESSLWGEYKKSLKQTLKNLLKIGNILLLLFFLYPIYTSSCSLQTKIIKMLVYIIVIVLFASLYNLAISAQKKIE